LDDDFKMEIIDKLYANIFLSFNVLNTFF